ncbi:hypothetical protein LFL96_21235 [Paraburkholderia sp. D15]|uniref:hypothetical protein n=1 Tax=Paraburkholderia sp. D15 TaxID=2880218 RepID=UPI00247ABDCC|nr:hypothetical protein [Paraburkholderia sp. D15]WGS53584.1 hypothetical protein LFL96_21235 [Paraburkholderia sp. D15]
MKEYKSFGAFARALERAAAELEASYATAMEAGALVVEAAAVAEFGHYQREDMGPFTPWAELKDATKQVHIQTIVDDEAAADAGPNTPELLKGQLRASVKHEAGPKEFVVGSEAQVMVWQELGTPKGLPPRPVLGVALFRNINPVLELVGQATVDTLTGKK